MINGVSRIPVDELQALYRMREAREPVVTRLAVPDVGRAEGDPDG